MSKIKVACIKFAGMANSGTEKYIQTIACLLDKDKCEVDFYYTKAAPFIGTSWVHPDTSEERRLLVESHGVKTIKINVENKIGYCQPYEWLNTNLWDHFNEDSYDIIQTARGGYPEYPFNLINKTSIIDSIHSFDGEDKPNIKKSILLCNWQANKWARSGGNISKAEIIPSLVYVPENTNENLRKKFNIPDDAFVYGFHQGNSDNHIPSLSLQAYSNIQDSNVYFMILGGSNLHREYATSLNLKNIIFLNSTSNVNDIHTFLNTIDVFAHSRSDGEVCSAAIIEAMYHGKPIISRTALNMGHAEQIDGCGKIVDTIDEYTKEMILLKDNKSYYQEKSEKTLERYYQKYDYKKVEKQIKDLYDYVSNER